MEEKKVREAIEAFQGQVNWLKRIDDKECKEARRSCIEYFKTAIEALEKQLPEKPIVVSNSLYNKYQCPRCNDYICNGEPICLKCKQPIDWLK